MKKPLIVLSILLTGLSFAANDLSDPQFALATFLAAVHDFSAERIWSCLSPEYQQTLEGNFSYMRDNGDLKYFADTFKVPELLNCSGTYQMLSLALNRIPSTNPVLYQQTRDTFDLAAIYRITSRATYQQNGTNLQVSLPDNLGVLGMNSVGGKWKINDISGFYIFQYC